MSTPARSQVTVLVPAAGRGERLGRGPKAALELGGRPIVDWVVDKARQLGDEVIVAYAPGARTPAACIGIEGGETRQDTLLKLARAASLPWVVIWDAARPFGSVGLARAVLEAAQDSGVAGAFLASEVPVALVEAGYVLDSYPAAGTALFQTPQAFAHAVLLPTLERAARENWRAQSAIELMMRTGHRARAVPGEKLNIKLTTPEDWQLALGLLDLLEARPEVPPA